MIIKHLALSKFRNHKDGKFVFSPELTILIGPNGCGKTNILESIFLLSLGKSFKADKAIDAISFGEEIARIKCTVYFSSNPARNVSLSNGEDIIDEKLELETILTTGEVSRIKTPFKKFLVNGVSKRTVDFTGRLKTVLFWPQDLELVTDSPSLRRRYLDYVLMQTDKEYRRTLLSYERGLRQRNKLLEAIRDQGAHRHQLLFWDQLLIKAGEYITKKREEYIDFVNNFQFASTNLQLDYKLIYDKSIISRMRLDQYSEEEVAAGVTLVGPHRDDIIFEIRNPKSEIRNSESFRNLSSFGSRGEQRLAVLWLKLAELQFIEKISFQKPVLLLDDVMSEFDHEHRRIIFEMISGVQTIITTTDMHFLPKNVIDSAEMIKLG